MRDFRKISGPEICPKRVWVLSVLSDDEAFEDPRDLPRGLSFHLSRCDTCRGMADRLIEVSGSLGRLSSPTLPAGLEQRALAETQVALGIDVTAGGRAALWAETALTALRSGAFPRFAAAAAIVLLVSTVGVLALRDGLRFGPVVEPRIVQWAPVLSDTPRATRDAEPVDPTLAAITATDSVPGESPAVDDDQFTAAEEDEAAAIARRAANPILEIVRPPREPATAFADVLCRNGSADGSVNCTRLHRPPTAVVLPTGARRMIQSRPGPFDNRR